MTIVLASGNIHKKQELAAILAGHSILLPSEAGVHGFNPAETGSSFAENALVKARALYALLPTGRFRVLADDSGLCVDALGGLPGVYSARYGSSGENKLNADARNALLLEEASKSAGFFESGACRACRFVCAMVLLYGPERFLLVQETLEGELVPGIEAARGSGGFGYDPVVYLGEQGRTVAELSETEKNAISHRAKAGRIIGRLLDG